MLSAILGGKRQLSVTCTSPLGKTDISHTPFIREMPKTLEDVADLGSYICALDKG
ncbi:MAG: hypothetical protein HCA25_05945 [Dolichospermum sp. DET50]|nr:hypothetical protein [Dolichospermum sp. DET66]MBS3031834.1 hypothetical protein [Dolichospermum sp. DET67]MBS3037044.1 hypothetical protein [Dolichospermum sp. DET50]QSX69054.1 MAG: hypothetical protein EZY12_05115 [Dolichospermum sp. DET69]